MPKYKIFFQFGGKKLFKIIDAANEAGAVDLLRQSIVVDKIERELTDDEKDIKGMLRALGIDENSIRFK